MQAIPVESTTLHSVAYDDTQQILRLEFRSLAVYFYFGVPSPLHQALLAAPSKGAYFNTHIRGRFTYRKETGKLPVSASLSPD